MKAVAEGDIVSTSVFSIAVVLLVVVMIALHTGAGGCNSWERYV
jgi:hypothetical protein